MKILLTQRFYILVGEVANLNDTIFPYLLVCPLKLISQEKLPNSVSLVSSQCEDARNNLKIINNQPMNGIKKEFGVCTKQMTYDNESFAIRFIEWVQMLRILGAEKIYGYNRLVHPNIQIAIDYLENRNFIEIEPFLEPIGIFHKPQSWDTRSLEINLIHDCFYRIRTLYKYIAVLDPDEVIMPAKETDRNWHDMMADIKNPENYDFFNFKTSIFAHNESVPLIDGIPKYHYMLQHIRVSCFKKSFQIFMHKNKVSDKSEN